MNFSGLRRTPWKRGYLKKETCYYIKLIHITHKKSDTRITFLFTKAVMTLNFKPLGVNDEESGYIGVISCFFSCVVALTVSYFTDRLKKHIKVCIIHCITLFIIIIF